MSFKTTIHYTPNQVNSMHLILLGDFLVRSITTPRSDSIVTISVNRTFGSHYL
jgi:hypothetical protein